MANALYDTAGASATYTSAESAQKSAELLAQLASVCEREGVVGISAQADTGTFKGNSYNNKHKQ